MHAVLVASTNTMRLNNYPYTMRAWGSMGDSGVPPHTSFTDLTTDRKPSSQVLPYSGLHYDSSFAESETIVDSQAPIGIRLVLDIANGITRAIKAPAFIVASESESRKTIHANWTTQSWISCIEFKLNWKYTHISHGFLSVRHG
ncbi:unnamed protein product [Phytophthora fragariaefolia]|uniref:Unnamed protein product n=1 Tax=Phytophthora fragariaefolia TaxID=1490495 RepID=A0A9W6XHP6_9STRA|nr:unnamed protein product [Phytophthora fragariaefolia]